MITISDPLHDAGPTTAAWTTVNAAEAIPGVASPLGWTSWFECCELGLRGAFADIGTLAMRDVRVFPDLDDRFVGVFHGHFAGNLDVMRRMADQIPGSSGEAYEEQFHAGARDGAAPARSFRRLPIVLVKLPWAAWRAPRTLRRLDAEIDAWWRRLVAPGSTTGAAEARAGLSEARRHLIRSVRPHTVVSMLAQGLFEQVRQVCRAAGKPDLELRLVSGDDGLQETRMVADLWEVAHGRKSLARFLEVHGFHGPAAGELSSHSWREDASPLQSLVAAYQGREPPLAASADRHRDRRMAEAELLEALSPLARIRAKLVLRLARKYIPLREDGRATFLKANDVARCMARRLGQDLVDRGVLTEVEDVFYLNVDEILGEPPGETEQVVAFRRARREEYLQVHLPERWVGQPTPLPLAAAAANGQRGAVRGIGVSPGVAEGRVFVVLDPADPGDVQPGDVLVCRTTDPSWASLLFLVSACVIDVGGPMSHGAIVARELGIPCVINTRDGTERLHSGDRIRVDGQAGTVEVLVS